MSYGPQWDGRTPHRRGKPSGEYHGRIPEETDAGLQSAKQLKPRTWPENSPPQGISCLSKHKNCIIGLLPTKFVYEILVKTVKFSLLLN